MRILGVTLLLGLLSVCSADSLPAFAWGSSDFVQTGQSTRRVSYQAESTTLLESLLGSLLGGGALSPQAEQLFVAGAAKPDVTVLFFGRKADAASAEQLPHLRAALDAAPASVSMPFMRAESGGSVSERLAAAAASHSGPSATIHHMGGCTGGAASAPLKGHELPAFGGATSSSGPTVVLVCPTAGDSLEDEGAVLSGLNAAVAAAGARHLFIYTSRPEAPEDVATQQRTLLAKDASKARLDAKATPPPAPPGPRVCDDKCRTQVNQLEAGILLFILLVSLGFGVYCMGLLDTPTRFESIKEDNR